jgi:hypothetical protein
VYAFLLGGIATDIETIILHETISIKWNTVRLKWSASLIFSTEIGQIENRFFDFKK